MLIGHTVPVIVRRRSGQVGSTLGEDIVGIVRERITDIPETVAIGIRLIWIRTGGTIIGRVTSPVAISVRKALVFRTRGSNAVASLFEITSVSRDSTNLASVAQCAR